jgi:dihydrolipoamide dehydrogenase
VSTEIRVPDIGDFTDVPVIEIHVAPGDQISVEDPLVTLESDKATMDVPAPLAGTVTQLRVAIGDRVSEGSVLMTLEPDGAGPADAPPTAIREPGSAVANDSPPSAPAVADVSDETPVSAPAVADVSDESPPSAPAVADVSDETQVSAPAVAGEPVPPPARPGGGREFEVAVLGAGIGGYTAAFRAADLGLRVALVERYERLGGVCLNVGCIPSKALLHAARVVAEAEEMGAHGIAFGAPTVDVEKLVAWKASVVDRLTKGLDVLAKQRQVEVVHGSARFTGPSSLVVGERELTFENCIIAAGSQAASLPAMPDDPRVIDSADALAPSSIPGRLLVIGGGIIGLEMACVYDALGARVTVVELLDQLLPGCDPDLVRPLARRISGRYEAIRTGSRVLAVEAAGDGLKAEIEGLGSELFDQVLVAVGRVPNGHAIDATAAGVAVDQRGFIAVDRRMRTNVEGIYAIGDIVGEPMLAHKASRQGKVAAEVIAGLPGAEFDAKTIPSIAYTDPEVAWMGLTETAARERGLEYEKAVFPWSASGRALGLGRSEGLTKLLFEPGSRRLLGCGVVGVSAGDVLPETVHALEMGASAEDLALTIHPHPTLSETVGFAAELAEGTITDLIAPSPARAAR